MKHTPAPWFLLTTTSRTRKSQTVTDAEGGEIATIALGVDSNPADATLIAAAPELLAALEVIKEVLMGFAPSRSGEMAAKERGLNAARAAIAKAGGAA